MTLASLKDKNGATSKLTDFFLCLFYPSERQRNREGNRETKISSIFLFTSPIALLARMSHTEAMSQKLHLCLSHRKACGPSSSLSQA